MSNAWSRHRAPLLRFLNPCQHTSASVAGLLSEAAKPRTLAITRPETVLLEMADVLGGVVRSVSSYELTPAAHRLRDFSRGCGRWNRSEDHAREKPGHVERRRLRFVPSLKARVMHRRDLISAVFRYASGTSQPCRRQDVQFLLPYCRPAALLGFLPPFAGLLPRMGEPSPFLVLGPTCRFARQTFAPINFRRGDPSPEWKVFNNGR